MITMLMGLALLASAELEPRRCQIDVRVTRTDPAAPRAEQREKVLAERRIVEQFGRPATFRPGELRPHGTPLGCGALVPGFELEAMSFQRSGGGIRLEIRVTPVGSECGSDIVRDAKPGKKYRFDGPEGYRIEVNATAVAAGK